LCFLQCERNETSPTVSITGVWECRDTVRPVGLGAPLEAQHYVLTVNKTTFNYRIESKEIYMDKVLSTDFSEIEGVYTYDNSAVQFVSNDTVIKGLVSDDKIILDTEFQYKKLQFKRRD
jgi:hypothetical protein